jgi:hypothetical protein
MQLPQRCLRGDDHRNRQPILSGVHKVIPFVRASARIVGRQPDARIRIAMRPENLLQATITVGKVPVMSRAISERSGLENSRN